MKEQLDLLHRLQELDSTIDACKESLAALDDGTATRAELEQARQRQEELEEQLHDLRSTLRDRELELEGAENEREEKWNIAYGGTVTDSRELSNLEKKIQELDRRKDTLENELLVGYEELDELEEELDREKEEVDRLSSELEETIETYQEKSANLKQRIEDSIEERAEVTEQLEDRLLTEYERLREKMGGTAVAELRGNVCSGCNIAVSDYVLRRLEAGDELVKCENCLRILYLPA